MIRVVFLAWATIAHLLLLASAAGAQSIEVARAAYAEGRFIEAADLAEALGTSEGYGLAAQSLTIQSYYIAEDDVKQALFDHALLLAQEAVRADVTNPEAHLQLSRVMGRYAQTIGVLEAAGYAEKVSEAIDTTLRLDPAMAAAHLSLAMWHAEVVGRVGRLMANMLYGATEEDALACYERALKLAPNEKVVHLEYALGLLLLDDDENREQARDLLARATEMPSKDAFDYIIHQRAVERLAILDSQ